MRVPRPLRELLGLVAVARHRRELALGDVAGELAQRGLVLGLGERIRPRLADHAASLNGQTPNEAQGGVDDDERARAGDRRLERGRG